MKEDNQNKSKKGDDVAIHIPKSISDRIQKRIQGTEFRSVSEYINYVLGQVVEKLDSDRKENIYSKEDEKKMKDRLKALGYMD